MSSISRPRHLATGPVEERFGAVLSFVIEFDRKQEIQRDTVKTKTKLISETLQNKFHHHAEVKFFVNL